MRCLTFRSLVTGFGEGGQGRLLCRRQLLWRGEQGLPQAIVAEVTAYTKKSFELRHPCLRAAARCKVIRAGYRDPVAVRENGLRSYVAELSKLGEMYAGLTRNAYKPVERAAAKAGVPNRLRSA